MKLASIVPLVVMVGIATAAMSQEKKIAEESKKADHADDLAAVKQLSKDYAAAWAKGDPELLLACYADDAVVIMSHEDPIVGKEALRELYEHVFASQKTEEEGGGEASMGEAIGFNPEDYTWTTEGDGRKSDVSGDLGYLWSAYATVATPKPGVDAEPIRDSGVSLLIVRRQEDGAWKVALMMATRGEHPEASGK
jgi:ketosteroid isomerase-like protein